MTKHGQNLMHNLKIFLKSFLLNYLLILVSIAMMIFTVWICSVAFLLIYAISIGLTYFLGLQINALLLGVIDYLLIGFIITVAYITKHGIYNSRRF
ncbi:hypothetical protein A2533_04790 [Candidatus Falkowbacteria bacterium RIFOXYD2_FULL_35_9]|uniref:Uncharacterized protein n=1 Tax=Candidatus Falkowbacteria bacterium RIFOXYC2_FULL_36_12 TaxID=1798002 RepID=A0A1F5SYG2_9BACT|nr:MAG: hypothetical protein A2478_04355 [Candidatus Falkowbacteria bacterium RIFOXYC2_FULL_36_12]OGF33181.1 MAG: hypothetical protein A2223_04935 [Candidatus Falkowbacteria bacterium RIFOXYA2_FULL_35_8]OGF46172.1 MAG: hypothetical protein A2533_04790 [Candidatus Falkowbacteria bacterium RIFOXYD2_FULL_35_9]